MKSRKTNKKTWLSAAIGFAFLILFAQPQRAGAQQWTTNGNHISNTNSGNVGIGTTSPNDKLEVVGPVRTSGSIGGFVMMPRVGNGALSVWYNPTGTDTRLWNSNFGDTLSILSSGNVGIGTMSPGRLVEIRENNTGLQTQLRLFHGNGDSGFNPGSTEIEFLHAGNQLATSKMRIVRTFNGTGSSNTDFYLDLVRGNGSNNGNTTNTALFAQGLTGNLGIDTTSPGYRLDVQGGQINASGGLCIAADCKTAWSQVGGAVASVFGRTGAVVAATNDYMWAQINKTTSSLADLTTRSASDLSSGTIPDARFPATLPSASGANLTALNASSLGGGTVATARLVAEPPTPVRF